MRGHPEKHTRRCVMVRKVLKTPFTACMRAKKNITQLTAKSLFSSHAAVHRETLSSEVPLVSLCITLRKELC